MLSRFWLGWKRALVIVQPDTVVRWHRRGFRLYWRWISKRGPGRPLISAEVRVLIGRTTRHPGYSESQEKRKRVEEIFGWMKTVGLMPKTRHRGRPKVDRVFTFTAAAYNLVRMRNLGMAM